VDDEQPPRRRQPPAGFALRDPYPWPDLARLTRAGEAMGYETVFLPEVGARDTLATLAGLAGVSTALGLGTGVVPLPARTTRSLAMAAATVQERSGGRLVLGIGTGPARTGALDRLREAVGAVRRLFAGERVATDGGPPVALGLVPDPPPPIWIAALGPRAVALAGEVADGVLLNWCTPERVASAAEQVADAATRAGRDPADVTVAAYVRACLVDDEGAAVTAAARCTGEYAASRAYAQQFAALGLGREAELAAAAVAADRPQDVPTTLVRAVCLVGDRAAARDRLDAYRAAGARLPVVYPIVPEGGSPADHALATLRSLAPDTTA
jgi:alkanesulfonate monooxygenase SsuD/methylene tetrahydromethanopterin reductase-like flavin-dependent oxidoreductase (luciferase family)